MFYQFVTVCHFFFAAIKILVVAPRSIALNYGRLTYLEVFSQIFGGIFLSSSLHELGRCSPPSFEIFLLFSIIFICFSRLVPLCFIDKRYLDIPTIVHIVICDNIGLKFWHREQAMEC